MYSMSNIQRPPLRVQKNEQMIAKFKFKKSILSAKHKIYYIGERSHEGYAHPDEKYFDQNDNNADKFKLIHHLEGSKIAKNPNLASYYDLTFSIPKENYENPDQYKRAVRATLDYIGKEKGVHLRWIGAVHDPLEARTQPHVHIIVSSDANFRSNNPNKKEWQKSCYVKFSKEDIAKMTNHMKKEMGMAYVVPEMALENENRIKKEWKIQTIEQKVAYEFGRAKYTQDQKQREFAKHPLDVIKKLSKSSENPQDRTSSKKKEKEKDEGRVL